MNKSYAVQRHAPGIGSRMTGNRGTEPRLWERQVSMTTAVEPLDRCLVSAIVCAVPVQQASGAPRRARRVLSDSPGLA